MSGPSLRSAASPSAGRESRGTGSRKCNVHHNLLRAGTNEESDALRSGGHPRPEAEQDVIASVVRRSRAATVEADVGAADVVFGHDFDQRPLLVVVLAVRPPLRLGVQV